MGYLQNVYSGDPGRIEKLDSIVQNKAWTFDPEAMMHASNFIAHAAMEHGMNVRATATGVVFGGWDEGAAGAGGLQAPDRQPPARHQNPDRDRVEQRFGVEAALVAERANDAIGDERDVQGAVEGRYQRAQSRREGIDGAAGVVEARTAEEHSKRREETEEKAHEGAIEAAVRRGWEAVE